MYIPGVELGGFVRGSAGLWILCNVKVDVRINEISSQMWRWPELPLRPVITFCGDSTFGQVGNSFVMLLRQPIIGAEVFHLKMATGAWSDA
jgi:hypothetical protein